MRFLLVQDVQRESLYEVFKHFGPIRSVQVKRSGDHCIAYCEFDDVESAQAAIASQDTHFAGKRVSCAELQLGSWLLSCPAGELACMMCSHAAMSSRHCPSPLQRPGPGCKPFAIYAHAVVVLHQHCLCSRTLRTCGSCNLQLLAHSWSSGTAAPDPGEEAADLFWDQAGRSAGWLWGSY